LSFEEARLNQERAALINRQLGLYQQSQHGLPPRPTLQLGPKDVLGRGKGEQQVVEHEDEDNITPAQEFSYYDMRAPRFPPEATVINRIPEPQRPPPSIPLFPAELDGPSTWYPSPLQRQPPSAPDISDHAIYPPTPADSLVVTPTTSQDHPREQIDAPSIPNNTRNMNPYFNGNYRKHLQAQELLGRVV
jgi:hypothetical protein